MAWSTDPDISVKFIDNSIRTITDVPTISKCSFLFCGFSSNGTPNKTIRYQSSSAFLEDVGSDVTSIDKYGYAGLYANHALSGGADVWWCRLMPENAKNATMVVSVAVQKDDAIPLYQRNEDNSFIYDDNGDRVPVMIDDPDFEANEDNEEEIPQIQKTTQGYRIKWIVEEVKNERNNISSITNDGGWKKYPLIYFKALYPGVAGNKYGFKLLNNFVDDEKAEDGRRYYMEFYKTSATGVVEGYDKVYYFALNPDAVVSRYSPLSEGLQEIYRNRDTAKQSEKKNIQMKYYYKNYLAILDELSTRYNAGSKLMIDILSCKDINQVEYDELIIDEDSVNFNEGVVFFEGGNDGSLGLGNEIETSAGKVIVDEAHIEETKIDLIKKYFTGKIDVNLEDCRKIQAGIIPDCNYDLEIKRLLPNLLSVRDDMLVFFDCGITDNFEQMTRIVSSIKSFVNTADWRYAIFPHCGNPVDSEGNMDEMVTQMYETVYKLPKIYSQFEAFSTYAGYERGIVDTFIPEWYVSNNSLKKRAKTLSVNYITDYGDVGGSTSTGIKPLWVDADLTLYNETNSVMKSLRNAVVAGDLIRLVRILFIKYRYGKSAESDMQQAGNELAESIKNRYPKEYTITANIYQTERNKITNSASCYIYFIPPNQTGSWDITIEANRNE